MRLLETETFKFVDRFDRDIPKYAILSHRWGKDEISYQDYTSGKNLTGNGYEKILGFCSLASRQGYHYAWIDTCCIDKKSSAELSEAINSMFTWYKNSSKCYVYLSDVNTGLGFNKEIIRKQFRQSQWFTRGWTLQELLAPPALTFYDRHWERIGNKEGLVDDISDVTGIGSDYLTARHPDLLSSASIATRMSWASKRETSRLEDMAYSLMGIFEVNMPLLYGEGEKAFLRLQSEIIKQSHDESIFAWTASKPTYCGLLAPSPSAFEDSKDITFGMKNYNRPPYQMTNRGLEFLVSESAFEGTFPYNLKECYLALNCLAMGTDRLAVKLQKHGPNDWHRVNARMLKTELDPYIETDEEAEKIYVLRW